VTNLTRVPPTRVPKRHQTGWLIKLLTFFVQRLRLKHNRWLKVEVRIVYLVNETGPVPLVLDGEDSTNGRILVPLTDL
jgi:hypothetical protein